ncbi:MAG: DUF971 domain-containing protein [Gallionella sp.]|nr:DUF971 domain-containing protein [Gallionella sp.]
MTHSILAHPTEIKLHQQSCNLEIAFDDGAHFTMPYEYLRVQTPSAEARGHGPGQETLQTGKKNVKLLNVEPVGTYALKLIFDDGHDSGLYTWEYLYELGQHQDAIWKEYLAKLEAAGASREFSNEKPAHSCGSGGCGH